MIWARGRHSDRQPSCISSAAYITKCHTRYKSVLGVVPPSRTASAIFVDAQKKSFLLSATWLVYQKPIVRSCTMWSNSTPRKPEKDFHWARRLHSKNSFNQSFIFLQIKNDAVALTSNILQASTAATLSNSFFVWATPTPHVSELSWTQVKASFQDAIKCSWV